MVINLNYVFSIRQIASSSKTSAVEILLKEAEATNINCPEPDKIIECYKIYNGNFLDERTPIEDSDLLLTGQ